MVEDFARLRLIKMQRLNRCRYHITQSLNKWEARVILIITNIKTRKSFTDSRFVEPFTHPSFEYGLLILFRNKISLNIMRIELINNSS